jgi:hypothetical protein
VQCSLQQFPEVSGETIVVAGLSAERLDSSKLFHMRDMLVMISHEDSSLKLRALLQLAAGFRASVARDIVYGILGIWQVKNGLSSLPSPLRPDYRKSLSEVWGDAIRYMIQESRTWKASISPLKLVSVVAQLGITCQLLPAPEAVSKLIITSQYKQIIKARHPDVLRQKESKLAAFVAFRLARFMGDSALRILCETRVASRTALYRRSSLTPSVP